MFRFICMRSPWLFSRVLVASGAFTYALVHQWKWHGEKYTRFHPFPSPQSPRRSLKKKISSSRSIIIIIVPDPFSFFIQFRLTESFFFLTAKLFFLGGKGRENKSISKILVFQLFLFEFFFFFVRNKS